MIRSLPAILLLLMYTAFAQAKAMNRVLPDHGTEYLYAAQAWEENEMVIVYYYYDTVPLPVPPGGFKADSFAIVKKDTARKHTPRGATIRSAIFPGWGQFYNKKYWKIPLAWAAVGIPAGLFFYNKNWYDRTRYALSVVSDNLTGDPAAMARVHSRLKPLVERNASTSLINYRNEFRRNMDYSVLVGVLLWGLQIVDATVDAHLRDFDVSDNISMNIKPAILPGNAAGLSLVFTIGTNNRAKTLPSLR